VLEYGLAKEFAFPVKTGKKRPSTFEAADDSSLIACEEFVWEEPWSTKYTR